MKNMQGVSIYKASLSSYKHKQDVHPH